MRSNRWLMLLAAWAVLLSPATARASGGWEGIGIFLAALLVPLYVVILLIQGLVWRFAKNPTPRRVVGILTLVAGAVVGTSELALLVGGSWDLHRNYDPYLNRGVFQWGVPGAVAFEVGNYLVSLTLMGALLYLATRLLSRPKSLADSQSRESTR